MSRPGFLFAILLAAAPAALAQAVYCRQIDNNKTYCSGGVIAHRFGNTTIVPNATPYELQQPFSVMPQNGALPSLTAPYSAAGTQGMLRPAPADASLIAPLPAAPQQPVQMLVVPPTGSRVCHQFGTVLVCN